jgi:hypothetical protein
VVPPVALVDQGSRERLLEPTGLEACGDGGCWGWWVWWMIDSGGGGP